MQSCSFPEQILPEAGKALPWKSHLKRVNSEKRKPLAPKVEVYENKNVAVERPLQVGLVFEIPSTQQSQWKK